LEDKTADLLAQLADTEAGAKIRLNVPLGAVALRTSEDAGKLRDLQLERQFDLTIATPDPTLIVRVRIYGFGIEDLRPPPPVAPPPLKKGTGALPALEELMSRRGGGPTASPPAGQAPPVAPAAPPPALAPYVPDAPVYSLQVGAREPHEAILRRLEHLAAGTRIRLQVAVGAITLRTDEDFERLREVWQRKQVHLTLVTADPAVVERGRRLGFDVEDIRRHRTGDAPAMVVVAPGAAPIPERRAPRAAGPVPDDDGVYHIDVAPGDRTPDLLRHLEALPPQSRIRMYVPEGARVLRTVESYKMLSYVRDRHASITVVSPDPAVVNVAKAAGFGGEMRAARALPDPEVIVPPAGVPLPDSAPLAAPPEPPAPEPSLWAAAEEALLAEATRTTAPAAGAPPRPLRYGGDTLDILVADVEHAAGDYHVEMDPHEPTEDLLEWLQTVPPASEVHLNVPPGAIALQVAGDFEVLRDMLQERRIHLVVSTPDARVRGLARDQGFSVQEVPETAAVAMPEGTTLPLARPVFSTPRTPGLEAGPALPTTESTGAPAGAASGPESPRAGGGTPDLPEPATADLRQGSDALTSTAPAAVEAGPDAVPTGETTLGAEAPPVTIPAAGEPAAATPSAPMAADDEQAAQGVPAAAPMEAAAVRADAGEATAASAAVRSEADIRAAEAAEAAMLMEELDMSALDMADDPGDHASGLPPANAADEVAEEAEPRAPVPTVPGTQLPLLAEPQAARVADEEDATSPAAPARPVAEPAALAQEPDVAAVPDQPALSAAPAPGMAGEPVTAAVPPLPGAAVAAERDPAAAPAVTALTEPLGEADGGSTTGPLPAPMPEPAAALAGEMPAEAAAAPLVVAPGEPTAGQTEVVPGTPPDTVSVTAAVPGAWRSSVVPAAHGAQIEMPATPAPELSLEVGAQEMADELVRRLEMVPLGARVRLYAPAGALTSWKIRDYKLLRDMMKARQAQITLISSDPAIISMAGIYGFAVEGLRAPKVAPTPPRTTPPTAISRPPLAGPPAPPPTPPPGAAPLSSTRGSEMPARPEDVPGGSAPTPSNGHAPEGAVAGGSERATLATPVGDMIRRGLAPTDLEQLAEALRRQGPLDGVAVQAGGEGEGDRLYQSLSALANRHGGGIILFGLDAGRTYAPVGVASPATMQSTLVRVAAEQMEPALHVQTATAHVDGVTLVGVAVPELPATQKPAYFKPLGLQKGAFTRVGATNQPMSDYEIFSYVNSRGQAAFDAEPIPTATLDDLDRTRLGDYLGQSQPTLNQVLPFDQALERVLVQRGIAVPVDGVMRPTLAGLLMFGLDPQAFEPQLVITFLHYYGTTEQEKSPRGERFLDNRKFQGPIPDMIEKATDHLLASIRKSSLIRGMRREDTPEYPFEAVREAFINAIVHRDYSPRARGSYIQIRLFADRVEIQSPGGLYGNVTETTLEEEQSTRNRVLMRLMEDFRFAENRGSGIRAIIASMREANLEPPRLQDKRSSFWVVLRNHPLMSPETLDWLQQFGGQALNAHHLSALAYLRQNEQMTPSDYHRLNEVDPALAVGELRSLVQTGFVAEHRDGSRTFYTLKAPATLERVAGSPPPGDGDTQG
ncbi:MAG TPA: ATP-binding protein, partial [Chloroflexia bacterium]|nr:ATP-binding protein [Chloroflexia bacterium]